jgi:Leucine-rich repeat (LRR) protein
LSAESLPNVKTLNLDGCPLKDWADIATGLRDLPALESLNLAATPINSIPECTASPLPNLKQLSLTGTVIARWRDIDHLSDWTQGKLEHLRISCAGDKDEDKTLHASLNTQLMTGNARTDRSFLIAKLPALTMLNGTTASVSIPALH